MNIIQPSPPVKSPLPNTSNHYVNNKELYAAFVEYKKKYNHAIENNLTLPKIPNYIGECILKIATGLSTKFNFALYPYKEEMISDGIENCLDGNTKILTLEYGPIEISKIVGQEVTIKCGDGVWRKSVAKNFGIQKVYRYWFGRHNQHVDKLKLFVDATENHRWYVSSRLGKGNIRERINGCVTDLRIGDDLMKTPYIEGIDDWSVIHGIIFGDGSGHKKYQNNDILIKGLKFSLPGRHNVLNAVVAVTIALRLGVSEDSIRENLLTFKGIQRRFDIKLVNDKMVIISDYAHHPTELNAVISAARELYPGKKITAVFQPHLFSRTKDFLDGFAKALSALDSVILLPIYPAREQPIPGIDSALLLQKISILDKKLVDSDGLISALNQIQPEVLLMLGAGDFDRMLPQIVDMYYTKSLKE